jgi:hypothetical protein
LPYISLSKNSFPFLYFFRFQIHKYKKKREIRTGKKPGRRPSQKPRFSRDLREGDLPTPFPCPGCALSSLTGSVIAPRPISATRARAARRRPPSGRLSQSYNQSGATNRRRARARG